MKATISKELINQVTIDSKKQEISVVPFEWTHYMRLGIGAIVIVKTSDDYYLDLGDQILNKTYMKEWRQDVGKLICRDLRNKKYGTLYELTTPKYKVLLRKISDDELGSMTELEFNHVLIGDFWYTIIKYVNLSNSNDSYSKIIRVDEEIVEDVEDTEEEVYEEEVDQEEEIESMSLF